MGCDIHAYAEVCDNGRWQQSGEFDFGRNYSLFGFLADVRTYSKVGPIVEPRGLPDDVDLDSEGREDALWCNNHSHSWLTLAELQSYDYDQIVWDRRVTRGGDGGVTTDDPAEGERQPLREFLGDYYFRQLDELAKLGQPGDVRIVFWFDN